MEGRTDRSNGDRPLTVDNHSHISQVEVQDIGNEYDKKFKYGMSHRDNLFLMDAIGVDVQVLHCSGYLHPYHRRVLQEHPDRFTAIAKIDERMLPGDEGLELLRTYVEDWGFKGWYYDPWSPESRAALARIHRWTWMDGVRTVEEEWGVTGAMIRARIRVDGRLAGGLQALLGAPMAVCDGRCGTR